MMLMGAFVRTAVLPWHHLHSQGISPQHFFQCVISTLPQKSPPRLALAISNAGKGNSDGLSRVCARIGSSSLSTPSTTMDELWPILDLALERRPLKRLALDEGFIPNRNGIHALRIGVDGGTWLADPNTQLAHICYRLCGLLRPCVSVVFVFEAGAGAQDPRTAAFHKLIEAFGFHIRITPGDVVTELARLNCLEVLDLIFTTDMEALVFGATHLLGGG
ncbi:hypothetical protein R3P38DRAFT_3223627 [Favolaschia claudopus]|uniref:XPG-I domain-containing protein n=1 Tax=Favolaschia claudopus TaxID=2862362 RepID=A0AAV9ZWV7_9AGAR